MLVLPESFVLGPAKYELANLAFHLFHNNNSLHLRFWLQKQPEGIECYLKEIKWYILEKVDLNLGLILVM